MALTNLGSIVGLFLILMALPAAVASMAQLLFLLGRRHPDGAVILVLVGQGLLLLLRLIAAPMIGGLLLYQSWRLDPILQVAVSLLALAWAAELCLGFLDQAIHWQWRRQHRPG